MVLDTVEPRVSGVVRAMDFFLIVRQPTEELLYMYRDTHVSAPIYVLVTIPDCVRLVVPAGRHASRE